ncbi:alpha/beta hydrolase family protein [Bordetella hinzii]|uniref:alpha/beta hydrolase family protein n=1 Tax=Bordetella hinzii TaxID=103855 RepID=UPI0039FCA23F
MRKILLAALAFLSIGSAAHAGDIHLVKKAGVCPNASPATMRPDEVALFRELQTRGTASMQGAKRIYYGKGLDHYGDLRLPAGKGPFPLAIVVHGGSWSAVVNSDYTAPIAQMLAAAGIASWNVEYSRLGSGGEWPESFRSVAAAADFVNVLAKTYPIDPGRVISIGHSSGGHYALWLAGRGNLPPASPLRTASPLKLKGVISLDGTPDLRAFAALPRGRSVIPQLLGADKEAQWEQRYAEASPVELLPLNTPQYFLTQESDRLASLLGYIDQARKAGDDVAFDIACPPSHFMSADTREPVIADAILKAAQGFVN